MATRADGEEAPSTMSFFKHHRQGDKTDGSRQDPPPAGYSQTPSGYAPPPAGYSQQPSGYVPPPTGYSQPPGAYSQPPQSYTQPPQSYPQPPQSYPPQGGYSPPPPAHSHQPYSHQPPTYPPSYSQPPPACSHEHPTGSYAGDNRNSTFRVYTLAGENYSLSIRDGTVILAPTNPRDEYQAPSSSSSSTSLLSQQFTSNNTPSYPFSCFQHWYKDFRWSSKVKDEEGLPAFALINKATGLAIKHSLGPTHPVRLAPYNPEYLDESFLWSESHDTGEGFRCIRMVNNIRLNFDAFNGDKKHGGVHDGTTIVLWEWAKGKNQRWKIVPYY